MKYFGLHSFLASNPLSNEYSSHPGGHPIPAGRRPEAGDRMPHPLHQPLGRGGRALPPGADPANDIFAIGEGCADSMSPFWCRPGWGCGHLHRAGPIHAGPLRLPGDPGHPRKAHLQKEYIGVDACALI